MVELEKDSKFASEDARADNCAELIAIMDKIFATKPFDEWYKIFKECDFLFSKINRTIDLASDPQVLVNDYLIDWDHPHWGPIKFMGFPFTCSETPPVIKSPAPELGQHTEEVLLELGYSWEDIGKLQDEEVI